MLQLADISKLVAEKDIDPQINILVTLGLSRRLGFTQKEICAHLSISQIRHSELLSTYQQAARKHADTPTNYLSDPNDTLQSIIFHIREIEKEIGIGKPKNQIFVGFPDAEI